MLFTVCAGEGSSVAMWKEGIRPTPTHFGHPTDARFTDLVYANY